MARAWLCTAVQTDHRALTLVCQGAGRLTQLPRVVSGYKLQELIGVQAGNLKRAARQQQTHCYLLGGQLPCLVDQIPGSAPLADAVSQIRHRQRG